MIRGRAATDLSGGRRPRGHEMFRGTAASSLPCDHPERVRTSHRSTSSTSDATLVVFRGAARRAIHGPCRQRCHHATRRATAGNRDIQTSPHSGAGGRMAVFRGTASRSTTSRSSRICTHQSAATMLHFTRSRWRWRGPRHQRPGRRREALMFRGTVARPWPT